MRHARLIRWQASAAGLILRCSKAAKTAREVGFAEALEISISETVMLALITSRIPGPATESADRDPGFLTLVFALARAVRSGSETAFARRCALARAVGGPNPL